MVTVLCTVRGCGEPLSLDEKAARCPRGHAFDRAKSGYWNLLQPQEKKSKSPGDSKEAVAARRRLLDAGLGAPLLEALIRISGKPAGALLDVGCGEGTYLAGLAGREAWGVDLSTPALESAAKRHPALHWVAANADRRLPFAPASFDRVFSITARRHREEFRRVLSPDGRLVIAVPAEDDQGELRQALLGAATARDRLEKITADLAPDFSVEEHAEIRYTRPLTQPQILDLLTTTYRGARKRERARAESLGDLDVTFSYRLARYAPR